MYDRYCEKINATKLQWTAMEDMQEAYPCIVSIIKKGEICLEYMIKASQTKTYI